MREFDVVRSNIVSTMIGRIIRVCNNNHAFVLIGNKVIFVDLDYWHKVKQ